MKKLTVILAFLVSVVPAFAQGGENPHLEFMDLPIEGSIDVYARKLQGNGYTLTEEGADSIIMTGEYLGENPVRLVIHGNPSSKETYGVSAFVEAGPSWASIEGKYRETVGRLKEIHGRPDDHYEQFEVKASSDGARLKAVRSGDCNYISMWVVKGGMVVCAVCYDNKKYYIRCTYQDDENAARANEAFRQRVSE